MSIEPRCSPINLHLNSIAGEKRHIFQRVTSTGGEAKKRKRRWNQTNERITKSLRKKRGDGKDR